MKAGTDAMYGPLPAGQVLAFDLVGRQINAACRPGGSATEVIHVEGAWNEPNPLKLTIDVIHKGHRYTVTINLATDEAEVRRHVGKERVNLMAGATSGRDYVTRKAVLGQVNVILHRISRALPFGGEEE